jgi:prepilin-type N-terminal cleavage/methylation domain-containing protein
LVAFTPLGEVKYGMKKTTAMKQGFTLVEIMIVVAIIGLLASIAIPNFVKARTTSQQNACINNLRLVDAAKQQWALEQRKQTTDTPAASGTDLTWAAAPLVNCRPARLIRKTRSLRATRSTTWGRPQRVTLYPRRTFCRKVLKFVAAHRGRDARKARADPGPFFFCFFLRAIVLCKQQCQ